jgi:hypothetical protein
MADDQLAAAALAEMAGRRPDVVALARVASVAAIVEPALLRRLRLGIPALAGPGWALDAGAEADLWFSRLAHVATAGQLTLRPAVAELLRDQLAEPRHGETARAARQIVMAAHAGHPDMVQLEERIIWSVVIGDTADVGRALDRALAAIRLGPDRAAEVVRWVMQARRRLPPAALRHPAGLRLLAAVAMHTDRIVPAEVLTASRFPDAVADVAPTGLPVTTVGAELLTGGIRFSLPYDQPSAAILTVPDTRPLVVEARWSDADGRARSTVIVAQPGTATALDGLAGPVVLRTLAGGRFQLRPARAREVTVAVFGGAAGGPDESASGPELSSIGSMVGLPDVTVRVLQEPADLYSSKPEVLVVGPGQPFAPGFGEFAAAFVRALERARAQAGTSDRPGAIIRVRARASEASGDAHNAWPDALDRQAPDLLESDPFSTESTIASAVRGVVEHRARMYELDLPSALVMLQALALQFHVRASYGEEVGGEASERQLFDLTEDPASPRGEPADATFQHVRALCEWIFAGPVQDYLDGREDPTQAEASAVREYETDLRDGAGRRVYDPGWAPAGGRWPSFYEYLTWFIQQFHRYAELMRDRLAPRTLVNRYSVPVGELEACRLALGTAALPLGHDEIRERRPREAERALFAVERARLPGLISALAVPVLAAVAAARAERETDPATRPYLEPAPGTAVNSVAFFPDGQRLATTGADRVARIWDVAARRQVAVLRAAPDGADLLAIGPDGSWLATASGDGTVRTWDVATGRQRALFSERDGPVSVLAIAPDGSWLTAGGPEGPLAILDTATRELRTLIGEEAGLVSALAIASDGSWLATAGDDVVRIWDVTTGRQIRALVHKSSSQVQAVAIAPDGRWLATGGGSSLVQIWDPSGRLRNVLAGHTGQVNSVAISPDGRFVASGSDDHLLRIWDAVTEAAMGEPFTGHTGAVTGVVFSPDGGMLTSASTDGTVRFWDVATGSPAR